MAITTRIEIVTPEKAQEYLKRNTMNFRTISLSVVDAYARDMMAGKWELNGEPIQFNEDGVLLNGQHRLKAIIRSGCSIPMMIVEGIANNVSMYDSGTIRSAASYASFNGIKNAQVIMGVAAIMLKMYSNVGKVGRAVQVDYGITHAEEITRALHICCNGKKDNPICRKAPIISTVYCLLKLGIVTEEDAELFCRTANSENIIAPDRSPSPAFVFARQVKQLRATGGKNVQRYIAEIFYKALMDFAKKKTRQHNYQEEPRAIEDIIRKTREMEG